MRNNKFLGIALWVIGFLTAHLIIFIIPNSDTAKMWTAYGFTIFAFLSQLALWLWVWHKENSASEKFLYTPALTISVAYLLLQLLVDLIFALVLISVKIVIIVNVVLAIAIATLLVLSLIAKNPIQRVDSRQKNHHREL